MKFSKKFICVLSMCLSFCTGGLASGDETYDKLKVLIDVMEVINTNYVSETKPKDLVVGAIKGVVSALDPFSQYLENKVYKEMKNETEVSHDGSVGLHITVKNGFLTVVSPISDTPAYRAGILPGDKIVKINNRSAITMSSGEAIGLMNDKTRKKVEITVSRDGVAKEIEFNLKRKKIKIETVKTIMIEDGIVYIRLTEFNLQSVADIKKALANYQQQGMKALILDLRNNPGGLLDSAIDIISMFIHDKKLVLSTEGRIEEVKREYITAGNGVFFEVPLVVLVNRGTASASEIFSGAMQYYKRALIIGNNTFGKGSVQTVLSLPDGTALKLTVAKYYLPSGCPIDYSNEKNVKNGITPDIEIKVTMEEEIKLYAQGDVIFARGKSFNANKVEDNVLNKAIEIIKENKIVEDIASSTTLANK
ncbi:MAG: S41 family peptidase [Endomicrobium sp.]|uniref:S41 family peptidase n=1 Tax=Candidatus Endomicrobiellum pyrsonymphae TaxID=1408203 RepID=UPI003579961D|nr:S41 family peptidase [Endomicrobium sp.]